MNVNPCERDALKPLGTGEPRLAPGVEFILQRVQGITLIRYAGICQTRLSRASGVAHHVRRDGSRMRALVLHL